MVKLNRRKLAKKLLDIIIIDIFVKKLTTKITDTYEKNDFSHADHDRLLRLFLARPTKEQVHIIISVMENLILQNRP